jgi:hypothetical protein
MDFVLNDIIDKLDKTLGVLFKYELHAFILLLTGLALTLHGYKEEGYTIIGSALLIFKGKN